AVKHYLSRTVPKKDYEEGHNSNNSYDDDHHLGVDDSSQLESSSPFARGWYPTGGV
ncbi:uncharacterized protein EV154DRAFT_429800, partial [Mucor mucedo]|uniref:uncharacterized protein n=1 Tax=Mucor mucedo TaxID=29922 RepID=UPI00221EC516